MACAALAACTASSEEVRPHPDQLFFPTGLAVSGDILFAANSNSELRFDSGAISVIDLKAVDSVVDPWIKRADPTSCPAAGSGAVPTGCRVDPEHCETLVCPAIGPDGTFIVQSAGVRIGNFATDIAVQAFSTAPGAVRLRVIVPTRGDPSITWADYDGTTLTCGGSPPYPLCDDEHRLSSVHNDPERPIPDEPFGVFADAANQFAVVTHLTSGSVTLLDAPDATCSGCVQIADVITGVFAQDQLTGLIGATGVAGRAVQSASSGIASNIIYVGSRSENRIQTFTIGRPANQAPPYLLPSDYFFLNGVGSSAGASSDTRGMQFSRDGNRLYVVNRTPPNVQIIDTSIDPATGKPRNMLAGASDICRQASSVAVRDFPGDDQRAYVTCFQDGQVYVVDPRGQPHVEDIITVGRGPYAVVAGQEPRKRLFVSNFLEDTIAVIDVDPDSATRNRVVLRIGEPRKP